MSLDPSTLPYAPGDLLAGRYRVLGLLGQGGMGTVWRVADELKGDREVALKTIRTAGAVTPMQDLAFREEYQAMTRLNHPNTLEVFDYGVLDDRTRFITMAILPGRELAEVIGGRPLPLESVYNLLMQLLQALDFIHSRLYVHRDIKAANVRVQDDGTLRLMDFGLMTQLGIGSRSGSLSGSPGYAAPETIRGGVIAACTDLYAVGCLAFEMLTGKLPFSGTLREVVRAHLEVPAPPLRSLRPEAPSALANIVARLLEKDPCARYASAADVMAELAECAGLSCVGPCGEQARSYLVAGALVGREAELATLEAAFARTRAGKGGGVLLSAPAGAGKSRLVSELLVRARLADTRVLHGACRDGARTPYEPLVAALRPLLAQAEGHVPLPLACESMFRTLAPGTGELAAAPDESSRRGAYDQLADWVIQAAGGRPVVLAIDDLHWADTLTLEAYRHLSRRASGLGLLVLGTSRSDEPGTGPFLRAAEDGGLEVLTLSSFSTGQVEALLGATLRNYRIEPAVMERLVRATGGNAFFLTETLRLLMDENALVQTAGVWHFPTEAERLEVPATVEAAVVRRFAGLAADVRHLARAASVMGAHPCRSMLLAIGGGREEALFEQLDELVARQILVREPERYSFFHDRVREAIYAEMPAAVRQTLHQAVGEKLEAEGRLDEVGVVNVLAHHFSNGTDAEKAYQYQTRAAKLALSAGALRCAISHWTEAIEAARRGDRALREERLAAMWWEIGSRGTLVATDQAIAALEQLVPVLEGVCEVTRWSARLKVLSTAIRLLPAGPRDMLFNPMLAPTPYVYRPARGWRKLLPPHVPSWLPRLMETYGYLGAAYGFAGQPRKGLAIADRALDLLPFPGTSLEGSLRLVRCTNLFPAGRLDELKAEAERAFALLTDEKLLCPRESNRLTHVASAGYRLAGAYQGERPDPEAERTADTLARGLGRYDILNEATHWPAFWAATSGREALAREWIAAAQARCQEVDAPLDAGASYLDGLLKLQAGEVAGARAIAERCLEHLPAEGLLRLQTAVLHAETQLAAGEISQALATFTEVRMVAEARGLRQVALMAAAGVGAAQIAEGAHSAARETLATVCALSTAGPLRNPLLQLKAEQRLAQLELATGQREAAERRLEDALKLAVTLDNMLEQTRIRSTLASLRRPATAPLTARSQGSGRLRGRTGDLPRQPATPNWQVSRAFDM